MILHVFRRDDTGKTTALPVSVATSLHESALDFCHANQYQGHGRLCYNAHMSKHSTTPLTEDKDRDGSDDKDKNGFSPFSVVVLVLQTKITRRGSRTLLFFPCRFPRKIAHLYDCWVKSLG